MVKIQRIAPGDIETESFRIIAEEMGPHSFSPGEFRVVQRMIHATGDFSFIQQVRFRGDAITRGIASLQAGKNVLVDVNMAVAGISKGLLERHGGRVVCRLTDEETARRAEERGETRTEAAMELAADENVGIVAIGNAPTALLKVLKLIDEERLRPDLVIGVPVGFVNAAESKELLAATTKVPYITVLGRKGGTPVAVATVNALLRLA
ncbi:MAG: precorrin-8X methylmutase [Desulfobulbus propionicus]|nr:MAG: precorrin-8X methylmutase [Desulfobulbus propionicus]